MHVPLRLRHALSQKPPYEPRAYPCSEPLAKAQVGDLRRSASWPTLTPTSDTFAGAATYLHRALIRAETFVASAPPQQVHPVNALREALRAVGQQADATTMAQALRALDEAWRCPITHAPFEKPCLLSCGHVFEERSLREARQRRPEACPMCRRSATIAPAPLASAPWYDELWETIAGGRESRVSHYLKAVPVPGDAVAPDGSTLHQALVRADLAALLAQRCRQDDLSDEELALLLRLATSVGAHACIGYLGTRISPKLGIEAAVRSGDRLTAAMALRGMAPMAEADKRDVLGVAIERDDADMLRFLLLRLSSGTPISGLLVKAATNRADRCLEALHIANYRADQSEANALLHVAATAGRACDVTLALSAGADIEAQDTRGRTALHLAAVQGRMVAVATLLEAGADATAEDSTGMGPFCAAVRAGQFQVAQYFFDHNLPMATAGAHPFHALVEQDNVAYAPLFLQLGFRPHALNMAGKTPLTLARERGALSLAAWLEGFE